MSGRSDMIYLYDGTREGLLCCIWTAFAEKENPRAIWCFDEEQPVLFPTREIVTDPELASRVQTGIRTRLGPMADDWVWDGWYSAMEERELAILEFLKLGFAKGPVVTSMLGHPQVAPLFAASRALHSEAHLLSGFIRFEESGGVLVAAIRPRNFVLPFLLPHFRDRFPRESFLIYDETHHYALVYSGGQSRLAPLERLILPEKNDSEQNWETLWRQFYDTLEIRERHDPRGRMTHVSKRYWDCMTELYDKKEELPLTVRQAIDSGELTLPGAHAVFLTPSEASRTAALRAAKHHTCLAEEGQGSFSADPAEISSVCPPEDSSSCLPEDAACFSG